MHQALTRFRDRIRTILPRHEQGGDLRGRRVCASHRQARRGHGHLRARRANLVTGLADAKLDSIPLVAITGQVPSHVIGTDAFQETPMTEVCRAITKHHYLVQSARDIARVIKEAFHIANTGRPGPVLIDIPKDIQNTWYPTRITMWRWTCPGTACRRRRAPEKIREVVAAIAECQRPIIYCGGGVLASMPMKSFASSPPRRAFPWR